MREKRRFQAINLCSPSIMPRVLRIINRLNLGGPTFNAAYLTKYLAPEYETLLVAGMIDHSEASSEFILKDMGLAPVYIPEMYREINALRDSRAYFKLKKVIRDFQPDIVHTHAAKAGALGRLAADACKVPVILHTFHGHVFHSYFPDWKSNAFINIERYLAKRSTRIIAISEKQKHEIGSEFKICEPDKIEIVSLGFDLSRFSENLDEKRKKFRTFYHVGDEELVIAIVSRLVPVKNHSLFLRAFKDVLEKTSKKIRAFIVGDGSERYSLEKLAGELGLIYNSSTEHERLARVTFTSWIKEVDLVYAGSDIIALTSMNEGTPVSLIEALAAKKPIATTNVGGISDFILDNQNGLIVPSNDVEAFSKALLELIENDSLRNSMEHSDTSVILQRFGHTSLLENMRCLYARLLHQ